MKVKDLIKHLEQFNSDLEVAICSQRVYHYVAEPVEFVQLDYVYQGEIVSEDDVWSDCELKVVIWGD